MTPTCCNVYKRGSWKYFEFILIAKDPVVEKSPNEGGHSNWDFQLLHLVPIVAIIVNHPLLRQDEIVIAPNRKFIRPAWCPSDRTPRYSRDWERNIRD